jgi:hypothetical protein
VLVGSLFSVAALSQPILRQKVVVGRDGRGENVLHWSAGIFPQEQVASLAQTHSAPLFRPQQVMLMLFGWLLIGIWLVGSEEAMIIKVG